MVFKFSTQFKVAALHYPSQIHNTNTAKKKVKGQSVLPSVLSSITMITLPAVTKILTVCSSYDLGLLLLCISIFLYLS
jgi:hypothetical protein